MDGVQWPSGQSLPSNYNPPYRPPQNDDLVDENQEINTQNQPADSFLVEEDNLSLPPEQFVPPVYEDPILGPSNILPSWQMEEDSLPEENISTFTDSDKDQYNSVQEESKNILPSSLYNNSQFVKEDSVQKNQASFAEENVSAPAIFASPFSQNLSANKEEKQDQVNNINTSETETGDKMHYAGSTIKEIELAKVVANPYQPRRQFNQEALEELSESIKEHGVIQPLVVTETPNGYELVVGERRFRASVLAGLKKVPAIIKHSMEDQTKLEVALIENIQRQELNPIEEALAYNKLLKEFRMSQDQVAQKVGRSRPSVANTVRLLNLPAEVQRAIIEGRITEGHGRAILGLPDYERQMQLFQLVLDQGLNVRQVENKVREILNRKKNSEENIPDPKLVAMESDLRGKLGTQVRIYKQGRGGKITIEFFSDEDLDDIISKISHENKLSGENYLTV